MKVRDVMTANVVSVKPETTVQEVAKLLVKWRISAIPVVDDRDHLVGIVSEGDLMRRDETDTTGPGSWWLRMFADDASLAAAYAKARGLKARDVMTRDVVTIEEEASLAEAAARLERNRIKRLPVIRDRAVVGILSRANLVQALASVTPQMVAVSDADRAIKASLLAELKDRPWLSRRSLNVIVQDGAVQLWGAVVSNEERNAIIVAAERTPGARSVEDHLVVEPIMQWD